MVAVGEWRCYKIIRKKGANSMVIEFLDSVLASWRCCLIPHLLHKDCHLFNPSLRMMREKKRWNLYISVSYFFLGCNSLLRN